MCWVIPPCSPAVTFVFLIASRREVFPWSTWPMTVTIGGRMSFGVVFGLTFLVATLFLRRLLGFSRFLNFLDFLNWFFLNNLIILNLFRSLNRGVPNSNNRGFVWFSTDKSGSIAKKSRRT